ncbi:subclass B1 metallo-beta-lactamase [uncultured Algimonas sp.]|uniref:subclass B1 metallo-beta-lactamase n=1 Tax=uncultured Algimonas sp. TaxID=1547920 RepID=UPI00261EE79A|nr:subclass B1 metallo-beta-lactamase [uncultured Algimonas sp.]
MTRALLATTLLLAACNAAPPEPVTPEPTTSEQADTSLSDLLVHYPVTLSPIAEGVWVHTSVYVFPGQMPYSSNGLVVVDGEAVTLIDGAWGEIATLSLLEAVRAETGKPVTRLIVTHHHADRNAGVDVAEREGIEVFTHPDTPRLAVAIGQPVPDTSVAALKEKGARTRVGRIEVAYPGHGHAPDNLVAWLPDEKILFGGCAVRGGEARSLGNIADADLDEWREAMLWTKTTYPDADMVVPGHGKGGGMALLDATVSMIDARLAAQETD